MDEIKISENVDEKKLKKIEKAIIKSHCERYKINTKGGGASVLVPNHKTQRVRELLSESGIQNS